MSTPTPSSRPPVAAALADRYLDLLKRCLTRDLFHDEEVIDVLHWGEGRMFGVTPDDMYAELEVNGFRLVRHQYETERRAEGRDYYPPHAETMVGNARLDNVQELVIRALAEGTPGDLVETGIWRGGTIILMRAILAAYDDTTRTVWACDSFQGLPDPDPERYPHDVQMRDSDAAVGDRWMDFLMGVLAVPVEQVKANIARYDLLDDQVRFLEGWFRDTLPDAPIDEVAVLRLDGDLYESTMDGLVNLEPKVSPGGFVIVDDYGSIDACRAAVTDYRAAQGITAEIHPIDWTGVWWQKPG